MRITLIKGQVETVICDGAMRGVDKSAGPAGLSYRGARQRQVQPLIRSANAAIYYRGNGADQFSFGVSRLFSTLELGHAWLLEHRARLPVNDDPAGAPLLCEMVQGGQLFRLEQPDLIITEAHFLGVTCFISYDLIGTNLTTSQPGA